MHVRRLLVQRAVPGLVGLGTFLVMASSLAGADDVPKLKLVFRTAPVTRGAVTATVQATGTLQPSEVVDVGAQVSGAIVKLGADPGTKSKTIDWGSQVDKDTLLAQIDPQRYQA